MKGLVFDIRRFSVNDGPGLRSTVFLKGCPLRCLWCHNPESQLFCVETNPVTELVEGEAFKSTVALGQWMNAQEVFTKLESDRIFMDESQGGITISGGEPLLQYAFTTELARLCHEAGLHVALDTTGYAAPHILQEVMPWVDLYLYDLKHCDNNLHKRYTGVDNTIILQNLQTLVEAGKKVIIRFPVIPGLNDGLENASAVLRTIQAFNGKITELNLLPYHSLASHKYQKLGIENLLAGTKDASLDQLSPLKHYFEHAGLTVKVGG